MRVYLVADRITSANVKGVFLHEVGVHYGLADMLGEAPFAAVLERMAALNRVGNAAVRAAYARGVLRRSFGRFKEGSH